MRGRAYAFRASIRERCEINRIAPRSWYQMYRVRRREMHLISQRRPSRMASRIRAWPLGRTWDVVLRKFGVLTRAMLLPGRG
eukprot:1254360-Rhodomonas_salina.1